MSSHGDQCPDRDRASQAPLAQEEGRRSSGRLSADSPVFPNIAHLADSVHDQQRSAPWSSSQAGPSSASWNVRSLARCAYRHLDNQLLDEGPQAKTDALASCLMPAKRAKGPARSWTNCCGLSFPRASQAHSRAVPRDSTNIWTGQSPLGRKKKSAESRCRP